MNHKDCVCGARIPREWASCTDCLTATITRNRSDKRLTTLRRFIKANGRVNLGKEIEAAIAHLHGGTQAAERQSILASQKDIAKSRARRAPKALREWYNYGEDDDE